VTDELASQPGALATRADNQEADAPAEDLAFAPLDFRLNLQARLAAPVEPATSLDNPSIRKLTWEHVVPDRVDDPVPSAVTPVPPPPPLAVPPPPPPPVASTPFEPPISNAVGTPAVAVPEVAVPAVAVAIVAPSDPEPANNGVAMVEDAVEVAVVPSAPVADVPSVPNVPNAPIVTVNRLASVPDLIIDDSPIELPPITPSGGPIAAQPQPVSVYVPVLPETVFLAVPRAVTTTGPTMVADNRSARRRSRRKSKSHVLRSFMSLMLLFGLLGGGAFAAKKYLLKPHKPTWSAELDPLAKAVATARGLEWRTGVELTTLPSADYATRLAGSVISVQPGRAETWRALGLLNGEFDLKAIGQQALNDSPAFYDPATKTIYVSDDLKPYEHLYRFALRRALASALLDQQFDWGARVAIAAQPTVLAVRATIDGDALAVANLLAATDAPDQLAPELLSFVQGHESLVAPSQYAATITGRAGAVMRPTITTMAGVPASVASLEQATPASDAVLDAARPVSSVSSGPDTQGLMFWYYVLASRIDDSQAWLAAVRWTGDSLTASTGSATQCVDAKIAATDADGAAVLLAAFQAWAAAAPVESTTTVAPGAGNEVTIRACDPGVVIAAQIPVKIPVVFGGAGVERALVQAAKGVDGRTKVDSACLINAARQSGTVLTSPADDAPVLAVDWQSAYVVANLDLAAGCVGAPG
jgi:hypothetical protein